METIQARSRRAQRGERGDALVIFCVGIVLLILPLGGLSVDLWHAIAQERVLQSAADAAAVAGAGGIDTNAYRQQQIALDPALATNLAAGSLNAQTGLPTLTSPPEVDVTTQQITVRLHANVPLILLRIISRKDFTMTATASSSPRPSGHP